MIPAPRSRPSSATYRRRRFVGGVLAVGSLTLSGFGARSVLAGPGGEPASASGARLSGSQRSVVVRSGDTLWSIAGSAYRADAGPDAVGFSMYLDEVIELNGGTELRAGDDVLLP